jgi:hypothetical protein
MSIFDDYNNCPICGKRYLQYPSLSSKNYHYEPLKYCSKKCSHKAYYLRHREECCQRMRINHQKNVIQDKARTLARKQIKLYYDTACSICGSTKKLHRHHQDYTKPLEVQIFCPSCHSKVHKSLKNSLSSTK